MVFSGILRSFVEKWIKAALENSAKNLIEWGQVRVECVFFGKIYIILQRKQQKITERR